MGQQSEGGARVGLRLFFGVHAFAEFRQVEVVVGRRAECLVRAFAHDHDADAEALGVFDHRREITVVRHEDERRGWVGSRHQFDGVDRQAHVGGVLARRVATLVDEFEFWPVLGEGAPAAEAALEVAISPGGRNGRFTDEAAQGRKVLV